MYLKHLDMIVSVLDDVSKQSEFQGRFNFSDFMTVGVLRAVRTNQNWFP